MLDWDGDVVKQFGYKKGVANIYVIDRQRPHREAGHRCHARSTQRVSFSTRSTACSKTLRKNDRVFTSSGSSRAAPAALAARWPRTRSQHGHRRDRESTRPEQLDDLVAAYPETCRALALDVTELRAGEGVVARRLPPLIGSMSSSTTRVTAWSGAFEELGDGADRAQFRHELLRRVGSHPRGAADPARAAQRPHREHLRRRGDLQLRRLFHLRRNEVGTRRRLANRSPPN